MRKWLAAALLLVAAAAYAGDEEEEAKLFARILDPATPKEERTELVKRANFELSMQYLEKALAVELELRHAAVRDPQPWHADVLEALQRLDISAGYMPGLPLLKKMPCTSAEEEQLMFRNLERFRMSPELYGVLRNLVLRHGGKVTTKREWFGWGDYSREDNEIWWASQAFVAEFAPTAEREMLKRLAGIVDRMRHEGQNTPVAAIDGTPNTALLAVVTRIDAIAEDPKTHCWLAGLTSHLLHGYELPRIPADAISFVNEMREYPMWDPDTYEKVDECHAWIATFRKWLAAQRETLERNAAQERERIGKARARMVAEELCR